MAGPQRTEVPRASHSVLPSRALTPRRGVCARRVRLFAIDLAPELVRTGYAHGGSGAQSPRNRLNRAIAVAELDGPEVALAAADRLQDKLAGYHAYHATRADLLRRLGRRRADHLDLGVRQSSATAFHAYRGHRPADRVSMAEVSCHARTAHPRSGERVLAVADCG